MKNNRKHLPKIIAHRGASALAEHENTLESFEIAIDLECDMAEFDIRKTKDGKLIVFHDSCIYKEEHMRFVPKPLTTLANAYGVALGHPEKTLAVLIGDGELETATAIDSLNLRNLMASENNGKVLPILHLNGYKISAPSLYARKSERELNELIRGFGFTPVWIYGSDPEDFQKALREEVESPFYILRTAKGETGPNLHHEAHQIPLKNPASDEEELEELEDWLRPYRFEELFDREKGFIL